MNTCVSDEKVVINVQGIRHVTWGESDSMYSSNRGNPWFVSVTYKGSHTLFHYKTEDAARALFVKIRTAMDPKSGEK